LTSEQIEKIFLDAGALLTGHFLLSSGLHSDKYLEKFRIFERPDLHEKIITALLAKFDTSQVETVIGPALGGVIMASEAGRQLGVRAVYSEKEGGKLTLRRGFKLEKGEKVLIVDDIVTTGGSVKETVAIAEDAGAEIIGIGVLADRSGGKVALGNYNYQALMNVDLKVYEPDSCPLCSSKIELVKPGSRKL